METKAIKSLNELALERLVECQNKLTQRFISSVRSVYGARKNGNPEHIGSCVIIEYNGEKFLITAAHVIDENKNTSLYFSSDGCLCEITGEFNSSKAINGDRKDDIIDVAALRLNDNQISQIGTSFIPHNEILWDEACLENKMGLVIGFPNSKNNRYNSSKKKVITTPAIYSDKMFSAKDIVSKKYENHNIAIKFNKKKCKNENGEIKHTFKPTGLSGGGLFLMADVSNIESYELNSICRGRLCGILIEFPEKGNALVATNMSTVKRIIEYKNQA